MSPTIHLHIATPSYGATVTVGYVTGLLDLLGQANQTGLQVTVGFSSFESLVTRARNTMVANFLAEDRFTHLMWIDSDIGFTAADVMRLVQADRPVAAGVYPKKLDLWPAQGLPEAIPAGAVKADFLARFAQYPVNAHFDTAEPDADGFLEVVDAPTGFMLIRREVFLKLIQRFPGARYLPYESAPAARPFHYTFFDTMVCPETGHYLSEDYAFCRRIGEIGVRPVIDTRSNLRHQGVANFEGDFARSLALYRAMSARR
jgi:hypothetical protein